MRGWPAETDPRVHPFTHCLLGIYYLYMQANASSPWPSSSRRPRWVVGIGWGVASIGAEHNMSQASTSLPSSVHPSFSPSHECAYE